MVESVLEAFVVSGSAVLLEHEQEDHTWEPEQDEGSSDAADEVENGSYILDLPLIRQLTLLHRFFENKK